MVNLRWNRKRRGEGGPASSLVTRERGGPGRNRRLHPDNKQVLDVRIRRRTGTSSGLGRGRSWLIQGLLLGSGLGLAAAVRAGCLHWVVQHPSLAVREIRIDSSCLAHQSEEEIREIARVREGIPLLELDLGEIRRRLEAEALIEAARVRRVLPGTLEIEVQERLPVAQIGYDNRLVIDRNAVLIESWPGLPKLPIVVGLDEAEILERGALPAKEAGFLTELFHLLDSDPFHRWIDVEFISFEEWLYPRVFTTDAMEITFSLERRLDYQMIRLGYLLTNNPMPRARFSKIDVSRRHVVHTYFGQAMDQLEPVRASQR